MLTARRARTSRTTVLIAAAAVLAAVAPAAPALAAEGDTVVGTVVHAYVEHANEQDAGARADYGAPLTFVDTGSGTPIRVPAHTLADVPAGSTVRVTVGGAVADTATRVDHLDPAQEVLAATVIAPAAASAATTAPGTPAVTDTVTIAMVRPAGAAQDSATLAGVTAAVSGPVAQFWATQSNGAVQLGVADTHDWMTTTADCSNPYTLWNEVAGDIGFSPGPGKHLMLYVPSTDTQCAYGLAEVGASLHAGGYLYVRDDLTSVIAHELGHNFGLLHSGSEECQGAVETGTCATVEYGDLYDVMGASWDQVGSLNAAQSARLGFLPSGQVQAVGASDAGGTYTLAALSGSTGTRAIRLTAPSGTVYYLEYRAPSGQDSYLGDAGLNWPGLQSGVLLHRVETSSTADSSMLLDPTPTAGSDYASDGLTAFAVGQRVALAGGEIVVTVSATSATAATVQIEGVAGDPACATRSTVPMSGVALLSTGSVTSAFVVGLDHALWTRPIDGDASGWRSLGGGVLYGPAAVAAGSTSYVFVVGTNGALFYRSDDGSGWSPWTSLGGYLTASPAAASFDDGRLRVFGRGLDGALWSREFASGAWSAWVTQGGYLTSPPTATADRANDEIDVQVRGLDGSAYSQSLTAGAARAPYQRQDVVACSAVAMSTVRLTTDPAQGAFIDSRGTPRLLRAEPPHPLGGAITSTPAVQFFGSGFVVAGRGLDNALWLYDGRAGGSGWRSLGGYVVG